MVIVVSPHLRAVAAAWDDGPSAGGWIAHRLGRFGPSVGHAVPLGYEAYAVAPIPNDATPNTPATTPLAVLELLLDVLGPYTGPQPVHFAMWDGWAWWYDTGSSPLAAASTSVFASWPEREETPPRAEIDRALADAREKVAAKLVERPDGRPLDLPHRRYYVWTGPTRSATAFRHEPHTPPSLIWPEDRSWFVGAPIYTNEIAVAGTTKLVDAVLGLQSLKARRATPDDILEGED